MVLSLRTTLKPYRLPGGFSAGVDRSVVPVYRSGEPGYMQPGRIYDARNVRFREGAVRKRAGWDNLGGALSGTIQQVFEFINVSGIFNTVAIGTAGAWSYSDGTNTWTNRATLAGSINQIPKYAVFNGKLVICNGEFNNPQEWDGVAASFTALTGSPPTFCRDLLGYQNHLLAVAPTFGATLYPYRVAWSDFNNENQWASGDAAVVDLLDRSDLLQAISFFADFGALFRRTTVMNILPAAAPAFYQFSNVVQGGLLAPASVQRLPQGIAYLSDDYLRLYNGYSAPEVVVALHPLIAEAGFNYQAAGTIVSTIDIDHAEYLLAFPQSTTSSTPDTIASWAYKENYASLDDHAVTALGGRTRRIGGLAWNDPSLANATWGSLAGVQWASPILQQGFPQLTGASGAQPLVQSIFLSDNGVAYNSYVKSGLWDLGDPGFKRVERLGLEFDAQASGQLSVYLLASESASIATATLLGPYLVSLTGQNAVYVDCDDVPSARYFGIYIVHSVANQDWGLRDAILYARPRGMFA